MFSDPISVTVAGVAKSLARNLIKGQSATYQTSDQLWTLSISHQKMNNDRIKSMVRLDQRKIVTNPLDSTQSDYDTASVWMVFERPSYGFSATEISDMEAALEGFLDSTSIGKLYGLES